MTDLRPDEPLSRPAASRAVEPIGWRYLLATLAASVAVSSLEHGGRVAAGVVAVCDDHADGHLRVDLRADRVELSLQTRAVGQVTGLDVELARRISDALGDLGAVIVGASSRQTARPVQMLEIAIDALHIAAIRPFWKAVLAYGDEPGAGDPEGGIVDPAGQLPTIWFQPMDAPRPQRNRVHFDITVSHDEGEARVAAALHAGGVLVNDAEACAFWTLADAEGNEVCVCTWLDRDQPGC
jgi:4a-hydroxytetrahydrobiopterin dehydratase